MRPLAFHTPDSQAGRQGLGLALVLGSFVVEEWLRTILGATTPQFTLMAVFMATLTPGWAPGLGLLFALGLVASVLSGLPLGLPGLMLVLMYMATLRGQVALERQTFVMRCAAFGALLVVITLAENALLGVMGWPVFGADVWWRALASAAAFPLYLGTALVLQRR